MRDTSAQIAFVASFINLLVGLATALLLSRPLYGIFFVVVAIWCLAMAFFAVIGERTNG